MQAGGLCDIKFHTRDEILKDEKQHDALDKSTSKQQVCVSDGNFLHCAKNSTHNLLLVGLNSRQADTRSLVVLKKFKR